MQTKFTAHAYRRDLTRLIVLVACTAAAAFAGTAAAALTLGVI